MTDSGRSTGLRSHWPALTAATAALLTAIGTLIGGLAAAGVIGGGNGETTPATSTETSADLHLLPFDATGAELRLASMIPVVHQPTCDRGDPLSVATVADLYCRPGDAAGLAYHLFETAPALNAYMNGRLPLGDAEQQCGTAASGATTYRDRDGNDVGRLVCYLDDGQAWIEWAHLRAKVYAYAFRTDENWKALFNFWTGAGPRA